MARQVASLFGVLRLDDSDYKNKLQGATRDTNTLGQTLSSQGQRLQGLGAGMTAFFAPVGLAMGYAVTQTHTLDRTFSNINSVLGITGDRAATLKNEVTALASASIYGNQRGTEAFYNIVSSVSDANSYMAIYTASLATAEAGQADLIATTSALTGVINAYGYGAEQATYVSDILTRTVAMGVGSMDVFSAAIPASASLASAYGISLNELGGSMAYLTTKNIEANQAATFQNAMITSLLNPTQDLEKAITDLGYSSGATMLNQLGLVGSYQALAQQNGGLDGLVTNTEALRGATVLLNEDYSTFQATYDAGVAGATERAGLIQDETEGWDHLASRLEDLRDKIGDALMPALNDLVVNYLTPAAVAVTDWTTKNPELTQTILMITGALVVAGPIIAGVGTFMTILGGAIGVASAAAGVLATGIALLSSPFIAIGVIVAGFNFMLSRPGGLIGALNEAATSATNLWHQLQTIIGLIPQVNFNGIGFGGGVNIVPSQGAINGRNADGSFGGGSAGMQHRAGGGDVMAGREYMVGENGPEKFRPNTNGSIIPNDKLGGGDTWNVNIYANDEAGGRAAARGFNDEIQSLRRSKGVSLNG